MLSPKESSWCHLAAYAETNSPVTCFFHLIVATARPLLTISTLRFGDGKSMLLSPNGYGVLHAMMKHNCEHMNKGRLKRIPTDRYRMKRSTHEKPLGKLDACMSHNSSHVLPLLCHIVLLLFLSIVIITKIRAETPEETL